ncbi:two-component system sensor histidine kinase NtrB [Rhodoligotrophos defluvii]|uniref:two-component system sensor histidine kinase NtrB n=1 Tax=Rhodoligotrophos defluvii TaxID=2561934 RepID=UPI0010C9BF5F|nr:nitrogen regulation protein NR(II) [Rhodoligotrophos defluvii]
MPKAADLLPQPEPPEADMLVSALPDPLLTVDADGRVLFANVAAEGFFQTSALLLKRQRLAELVPFASPILTLVDQVRQTGVSIHEYAVDVGTPRTGGERLVDLQVVPVPERRELVLIVLQPRSMAHKIDRQLTHRNAARSVTGMASMLAHEIKNPLSGIRGAAQLLEPALSDEDRALARLICEETDRICTLVDQMEEFADERPVERAPINIHAVLDHVKAVAINGFARGIRINEEYDPSLPPVLANRDQLIQVFMNLVKNAAEAISSDGDSGEITLSTAFRPGMRLKVPGSNERVTLPLEYCVHDTGPGIPEELMPHLFDPFVTTKPSGKGLGLALVAKIIRDHGGIIECTSQDGRTTFRILMPMHNQLHREED